MTDDQPLPVFPQYQPPQAPQLDGKPMMRMIKQALKTRKSPGIKKLLAKGGKYRLHLASDVKIKHRKHL